MKSNSLKQNEREPFLKVIKNISIIKNDLKTQAKKIYINTLIPDFSYTNHKGVLTTPKKCALI